MKNIKWIILSVGYVGLLAACQQQVNPDAASQPTAVLPATRAALPATWTQAPTPTQAPSHTPHAIETSAQVSPTASKTLPPVGTPTPDPVLALLPDGAVPLRDQGWAVNPENSLAAFPYQMSDDTFGLAVVDDFEQGSNVRWTWHQDALVASHTWTRIRRLSRTVNRSVLLFVAQDTEDQWFAGAIYAPVGEIAQVIGLIPLQDPQNAFVVVSYFTGHPWEFWAIENKQLKLYQWQNNDAVLLWTLSDVPSDAVFPALDADTDVTGDGVPELWLRWWPWSPGGDWASSVYQHAYYVVDGSGYRNVANFSAEVQRQDVDGDGVKEFLTPDRSATPQEWVVTEWNGEEFKEDRRLTAPQAPLPQVPKLSQLPPLSADLYFIKGDAAYLWPQAGGELQTAEASAANVVACNDAAVPFDVVSWSPGCGVAVVKILAEDESYRLGLLASGGVEPLEIPNTLSTNGRSSFGWDPAGTYVLHGRAGENPGLYRVWLGNGQVDTIFSLSSYAGDLFGVTAASVRLDGSYSFVIQGSDSGQYPAFGIYLLLLDGTWRLLADMPSLGSSDPENVPFGRMQWSLDGSSFIFYSSSQRSGQPPYNFLLLGMADGSAVWDLNPILGKASDFTWK